MKKIATLLAMALILVLTGCAHTHSTEPGQSIQVSASSDPDSKILTKTFNNSTTLRLKTTASYAHPTSIIVTFPSGAQTMTWNVDFIMDGITHHMVDFTGTGQTFIWYVPNYVNLDSNTQIYIETGIAPGAVAIVNLEF